MATSPVHQTYNTLNMSADMNPMFTHAYNDHVQRSHASLMASDLNHFNSMPLARENAQNSPAASTNNSSRYTATEGQSPLDKVVTQNTDVPKQSTPISRDNESNVQLSPSTTSTVSPNKNEATINSPANSVDQHVNSPSVASNHGEHSSMFQRDINQTPQLPPYSGGYFHNILASYHGYRNMTPPQNSELDQAMATNIANIAKSVVQGTSSATPGPSQDSKRARDKPFQCTMCHKRYTNRAGLTVHVLSHTGNTSFPCTICPKRFTQKSTLEQHMLTHSNQRPFECKICYKTFTQRNNLHSHMMIHNGEEPYQCRICDKRFTQRSHLSAHIGTHSDGEKMQTAMAMGVNNPALSLPYPVGPTHTNEMFQKYNPSSTFAGNLQRDFNETKPRIDNIDNSMDTSETQVDRPKDLRHENQQNLDNAFDKSGNYSQNNTNTMLNSESPMHDTNQESNADHHMTHYPNDSFQNILANIRNSFVGNVRPHSAKINDNKERPFQCMFCDKRFTQRAGLNAHVLIHSGTRPFGCTICDKRFTQKSGLDQHFLTHTGERPHHCPLCDKRFTQKANLNHHILTHTGEKRHICPFCDRRFTQKANLNAHILTHTGQKPHQCVVCDRKFTQKSGLNQHMLTHTGEKPYTCKLCDKSYTQKSGLDVHMYSHSGEKPYRCQYCDKQFVARTLWVKHLRANHDHDEPPAANAYGRGGHGGMNLLPPAPGLPGFKPTFDMLKNAGDFFKQPPSDCFKLLHESYSSLNNKNAESRPGFNPGVDCKSDLIQRDGRMGEFEGRSNEDLKSPENAEASKSQNDSYSHSSKFASHFKESLSSDSKQNGQKAIATLQNERRDTRNVDSNEARKNACSFDALVEQSSRGGSGFQFPDLNSSKAGPNGANQALQNENYSQAGGSNELKRANSSDAIQGRFSLERGHGQAGYKPKTSYLPGNALANEVAAHGYPDSRLGNLYQERYMNMYRDMVSNSYLQDAPPAFI